MLSKLTNYSTLAASVLGSDLMASRQPLFHPVVQTTEAEYCLKSVDRLEYQPTDTSAAITESTSSGTKWTDTYFTGGDVVYYPGFQSSAIADDYTNNIGDGTYFWSDWQTLYPNADIFDTADGLPDWREPRQGGAGTCYLMSSLSGVAEFPELIRNTFVTKSGNAAGISQMKFFIRGKPWIFNIDGQFLAKQAFNNALNLHNALKYALINTYETDKTIMWAPILEKAWAKIKGNYNIADGGFIANGLTTLTGAPVFNYNMDNVGDALTADGSMTVQVAYDLVKAANTANYIMGAGTDGGADTSTNSCGIAMGHAYSIITTFEMTDASSVVWEMLMFRNPWGSTSYSQKWGPQDSAWTDALKAQVPYGFDPTAAQTSSTTDGVWGVFVMDKATWGDSTIGCLSDFSIAHYRDGDGYNSYWYDRDDATANTYSYKVTVPTATTDLYFSVQGWYYNMIPAQCQVGDQGGHNAADSANTNGLSEVFIDLYKESSSSRVAYSWYNDQLSYPLLVLSTAYTAGEVFTFGVEYYFSTDNPAKDYTARVYSKVAVSMTDATSGATNMLHMDGTSTPSGFKTRPSTDGGTTTDPDNGTTTDPNTGTTTDPDSSNTNENPFAEEGITTVSNLMDASSGKQLLVSAGSLSDVLFTCLLKPDLLFDLLFTPAALSFLFTKFF